MPRPDKKKLSERDICTKYITPALVVSGWDLQVQIREEVSFTKGRVIVRGKLIARGDAKRADYILDAVDRGVLGSYVLPGQAKDSRAGSCISRS